VSRNRLPVLDHFSFRSAILDHVTSYCVHKNTDSLVATSEKEKGPSLILITNFRYLIFYSYVTSSKMANRKEKWSRTGRLFLLMCDRHRAGIPRRHVTKPTRTTQPCIPHGSINRVPVLIGCDKGGSFSAGWHVTLRDPT